MIVNFRGILWESFRKSFGIPSVILAIILGFIFWKSLPSKTVPLFWVVLCGAFIFILFVTLSNALYEIYKNKSQLPKVITSIYESNKLIILLRPSDLFSIGTLVSFYYLDENNYERAIGMGCVLNIQNENKIIQVELTKYSKGKEDLIQKIKNKNKDILNKLLVKPHIQKDFFEESYIQKEQEEDKNDSKKFK